MSTVPATISAVAATVAAILAGINIYLIRRNENVKWAREALVDSFTSFLSASFESKDRIKLAVRTALTDPGSPEIARLRREADEVERTMRDLQTRLRLLTGDEVVAAAQELRFAVRDYIDFAASLDEVDAVADKQLRVKLWRRREAFIAAAQKALAL